MKKKLSLLLVVCLLVSALPNVAFAEDTTETTEDAVKTTEDGLWQYNSYGKGVELTAYLGADADVFVPGEIEADDTEMAVVKLGDNVFANNDSLNSVTLDAGITEIGASTFEDADSLVCIVTTEDLTTIGAKAFYSCDSFNSIILYDGITSIGENAFAECPNLTVWCNEGTVGYEYAVANNIPYEILNPDATPETITMDGFTYYISNGEAIAIGYENSEITSIEVPSVVNGYPVTGLVGTFKNFKQLLSVSLPNSIQSIGAQTFLGCYSLTEIVIPNSVETLGTAAFGSCIALKKIVLPDSVTLIGEGAFSGCRDLMEVTLSKNLASTGDYVFEACGSLKRIVIPEGVKSIGYGSFFSCSSLEEVVIPSSVTSIYSRAFAYCTNLSYVEIPATVTTLGSGGAGIFVQGTTLLVVENSTAHTTLKRYYKCISWDGITRPEFYTIDGVTYYIEDGNAIVFNCVDSVTEVIIPETVNGYPVTELRSAFTGHTNLRNITIPDSVTTLGSSEFSKCISLEKLTIPKSVTSIGLGIVQGCSKLTDLVIPGSVERIMNLSYLVQGCTSLEYLTFGEGITYIGSALSCSLPSLRKLVLPKSLTQIVPTITTDALVLVQYDSYAQEYAYNNNLSVLEWDGENEPFYTVNGVTYCVTSNCEAVVFSCDDSITEVSIVEKVEGFPVTSISGNAFKGRSNLTKIVIPAGITTIGTGAFTNCTGLTEISFSKGITDIGGFGGCTNLTKITFPDGVTSIGTISDCDKLTEVVIPEGVTYLGGFSDCTGLSDIQIPDSVTSIGSFSGCTGLTELVLPKNLVKIDSLAGCTGLTKIVIPEGVTLLNGTFARCTNLKEISLPNSLTQIGISTFERCTSLTEILLPSNLTSIWTRAFNNCSNLKSVVIPENVTQIASDAFSWCTSLTEVTIPSSLTTIGSYAFQCSDNIQKVYIRDIEAWCDIEFGSSESNPLWAGAELYINNELCKEIVYPDSITQVKNYVFSGLDSVSKITLHNAVTSIGEGAFSGCGGLTELIIPEGVTSIGKSAFLGCSGLTEIIIPEGITSIENELFSGCTKLNHIVLPESVTSIGTSVFRDCDALTEIIIPTGITCISQYLFRDCDGLTKVVVPEGITMIDHSAFYNCANIRLVQIPDTVTSINIQAFYGCEQLKTVRVPSSVVEMWSTSFPVNTILLVQQDSYAHTFAQENGLLNFVLFKTDNPEIDYGMEITGTVSGAGNVSATETTVQLIDNKGNVRQTVTTDENGTYNFTYAEVGIYTIQAVDTEGNTATQQVAVKRMNVFDVFLEGDTNLVLKQSWSISGTVSESTATITLTDMMGNVLAEVKVTDGAFTIEDIPNGTYIIKAETESGSATKEVTVFDGDLSDLMLEIITATAGVWGYVEVEDRDEEHHRRNWVQVTIYNEDGSVVDQCKSDKDGKYEFTNLLLGEYTIVAETAEMRHDKKHGYDRSHTLTGYVYVNVTEAATYQADTIILYEESEHTSTITGKVTTNGEKSTCDVILTNSFQHEVARQSTGANGKYAFVNVKDGLYFITAITESDGMGFTVVVVRDGKVYGNADIVVAKSDKIKGQETSFNEISCNNRDDAVKNKERIVEERQFYDGLSEKEKRQFSKDYIDRLNRYSEWLADCSYDTPDDVTVENGGMIVSGDELYNEDEVSFKLTVEEKEAHVLSGTGVQTNEDYIQHAMEDTAGKREIKAYYEITMTKTVNGEEQSITNVLKETDATGKFRITMPIPVEYQGHKNYSIIHEHHGEVVTLTDLDDDPTTITFEVDKFSTFALAVTDETLGFEGEGLKFSGASLTLQNDLSVNYKVSKALLEENGYTNPYVKFVLNGKETIVTTYRESGEKYVFDFTNIAPNQMNDTIYATLYATNGEELYASEITQYSVSDYCYNMLAKYSGVENYKEFCTLLVDLLNYGAASQEYTNYDVDALVNASLTEEQKAMGTSEMRELSSVFNKEYESITNPSVTWKGASLKLEDSVTIRFTIEAEDISGLAATIVCGERQWSIDHSEFVSLGNNKYYVYFEGLNAAQMSDTVYAAITQDGVAVSNTVAYSIESYASSKLSNPTETSEELKNILQAMMKYGDAAKAYLASINN